MILPATRLNLFALCLAALAASATPPVARAQKPPAPVYTASPVFFEMFYEEYAEPERVRHIRQDRIDLEPLGEENIADFDWINHQRSDQSWWQRIESFVYLLPLIASQEEADHAWLRGWFDNWYGVHVLNPEPNVGAWDPMTAAQRAMVLVYWLKTEEARGAEEKYLRNMRRALDRHQIFLKKEENFEPTNNHGMWESIGLFETVRVLPSVEVTQIALDRLITLVKTGVSQQGIEKEHSPSYHFYFREWLAQYVDYLGSLNLDWGRGVEDMAAIEKRMRDAIYFLCDHNNRLPQIGDTDGRVLEGKDVELVAASETEVLYDPEAGLAIFKDSAQSKHKRYIVFCNQNEQFQPTFRHHFHNDMMSVFYSDDGEVILGDGGRHSYERSPIRAYIMSMAAHNTIIPEALMVPESPGIFVTREVWAVDEADSVSFGAALVDKVVQREIIVPRNDEGGFKVRDAINNPDVFVMLWRLGPDVASYKQGKVVKYAQWRTYEWELRTAKGRKFRVAIRVDGRNGMARDEMSVVEGKKDPYLGWYSPGYKQFEPAPTIKLILNPRSFEEPIHVTTRIQLDD